MRIRKLRDLDAGKGDLLLTHMLAAMPGDADNADERRKQQHRHTGVGEYRERRLSPQTTPGEP
jgi:hypothetical protein